MLVVVPTVRVGGVVTVLPSTRSVRVPVGAVVLEEEPEATVMVMLSLAPEVGVVVAADSVVVEAASVAAVVGL